MREMGLFAPYLPLNQSLWKCGDGGKALELHVAEKQKKNPFFSASYLIADLVPFNYYNWEYNWRWLPSSSPGFSQGNHEVNVTVSIVRWPSISDYYHYEGLEFFVEGLQFDSCYENMDLVLSCELTEVGSRKTTPISKRMNTSPHKQQSDNDSNLHISVMQHSSGTAQAAYFFFSCSTFDSMIDHQIYLTLYASIHNAGLWWNANTISSAFLFLSEGLRRALSCPENKKGVRWELEDEDISHSSVESPVITKLSGILRWKDRNMEFLSDNIISQISELPLLRETVILEPNILEPDTVTLQSYFDDIPDFRPLFSRSTPINLRPNPCGSAEFTTKLKGAVTKMGQDILRLRQENENLKKEKEQYERYVLEREASIVVTAANQKSLQSLTKDDLIHKIIELSNSLTTEIHSRETFQSKVRMLHNSLIKKNDIESRYIELQEAYEAQQKLVGDLQAKVNRHTRCSATCKQQEMIIKQMEILMAKQSIDSKNKDVLSEENARLRELLSSYQKYSSHNQEEAIITEKDKAISNLMEEVSKLTKKLSNLSCSDKQVDFETQKLKLELAEAREKAVMEELKASAVRWAKEKAIYELQIAELKKGKDFSTVGSFSSPTLSLTNLETNPLHQGVSQLSFGYKPLPESSRVPLPKCTAQPAHTPASSSQYLQPPSIIVDSHYPDPPSPPI